MSTNRRKPVIGLLGAPGSGKSLVARQMAELGCGVIDADKLAREALDEPEVRAQIGEWWPGAIGRDGRVDRKALAKIVFHDPAALRRLEDVVHPRVGERRMELRRLYQADALIHAIVEDAPLLLEKNLDRLCDVLVFVDAPREVRLERVRRTRDWSDEDLAAREKNQTPLDTKRSVSDYVIQNDDGEAATFEQVRRVLSKILHETSLE